MKILIIPVAALFAIATFGSCKSGSSPDVFCDTICLKDTLKFTGDFKLRPYVYISVKECKQDTIIWSYDGMGTNRKIGFADLLNSTVNLNKDYIRCVINDTSYAWLLFNDCVTGRGYQLKLPFNKTKDIGRKSSGINNMDPKFNIDTGLLAYSDRGNIYVEALRSGKNAMMTFGKATGMDYDAIHETLDSVHVSRTRIWVKVKVDDEWVELEKKIMLD